MTATGTYENWRPDEAKFSDSWKSKSYYSGSSKELWLKLPKVWRMRVRVPKW